MENIGMFSDTFPACNFPKTFNLTQIKEDKLDLETAESEKKSSDSTDEDEIKMFVSPEKDSKDFEISLKKTMECIAQVCDTTVPEKGNTPQRPRVELLKPTLETPKKNHHHHQGEHLKSPLPRLDDGNSRKPDERYKPGGGPIHASRKHTAVAPHPYSKKQSEARKLDQVRCNNGPSMINETVAANQPANSFQTMPSLGPRSPTTANTANSFSDVANAPLPYNKKNHDPNPQHFIFPDCTDDLQKEFFMFYVSRCLEKNKVPFPADENTQKYFTQNVKSEAPSPSTRINSRQVQQQQQEIQAKYRTANNNYYHQPQYYNGYANGFMPPPDFYQYPNNMHIYSSPESGVETAKKFVDSTTSPIHPQYLENKENHMFNKVSPLANSQTCKFSSPGSSNDIPPQKLNFTSPNPPPVPPHLPNPQTPVTIPNTPIMGPSLEAGSVLGSNSPVYVNIPRGTPPNNPSQSAPPIPPRPGGYYHTSRNRSQNGGCSNTEKVGMDQGAYSGNVYHRHSDIYQKTVPNGPVNTPSMVPNIDVRQAAMQALNMEPHLAAKPSSLPQYYFPDTKKLQFNLPHNRHLPPASDKAIPDSLAASYLSPGELNAIMRQQPIPNHHQSPFKSSLSNFKDTMGKFLGGRKRYPNISTPAPPDAPATSGKRTKFTTEQIRILDHYYHNINKYVVGTNKATLRQMTGLELNTILMWFQNKRAREKKSKA